MKGRYPKAPGTRQRRNRTPGARVLSEDAPSIKPPDLPPREGGWSTMTMGFWRDVWSSPMAPEFVKADNHGLFVLAELVQQFWEDPGRELAAEIRLQRQSFGLSPIDRRRLQWEIERTSEAQEKGAGRRGREVERKKGRARDPRKVLKMVKGDRT